MADAYLPTENDLAQRAIDLSQQVDAGRKAVKEAMAALYGEWLPVRELRINPQTHEWEVKL